MHVQPADISWDIASEFEKYIVTLYWTVTTITSVGWVTYTLFAMSGSTITITVPSLSGSGCK